MAIKVYSPTDFEDTSSGVSIDGNLVVDTSVLYVDTANNRVGIGTTNPLYPLAVESSTSGLVSRIYNTNADGQGLLIRAGSTSSATRVLQLASSNDTKIMTVTSSGNVGIGTTSPSEKLDVIGNIELTQHLKATGNNLSFSAGGNQIMNIDLNGKVYPSTDSAYDLGFSSTMAWRNLYVDNVLANGNVGIDTTIPQKKLDVNGSGIVASIGGAFSAGSFAGFHFGYSETTYGNDLYKKSALVFERTDNHSQGGNASGKIHFLLNNISNGSATSLSDSVVTIDTDAVATQGSARVGIGTTSPQGTLEVEAASTINGTELAISNDYGESEKFITFRNGSDIIGQISTYGRHSTSGAGPAMTFDLSNGTSAVERLRITKDGNVGIGTSGPTSYGSSARTLEVRGNTGTGSGLIRVSNADNSVGASLYSSSSAGTLNVQTNHPLTFATNNSEKMRITSSGNVGIGTTSPSYVLDTVGSPVRFTRDSKFVVINPNFASLNTHANIQADTGMDLSFTIGGSERMRIGASGNVGIGTSSPQQKLQVDGNIYLGPNNTNNFIHSGAHLGLQADGEVRIVSDVNDSAGVGASDIVFGYGSSTNTDSNQDFTEAELSTYPRVEIMRIAASTSRVGIGTTSPSEKLEVVGNIKLSGIQYAQASSSTSITPSAGDWIDIVELNYGEHHGRIALEWNSLYAPSSSHHGWAEFEVGTYYSSSYNYGQDTYLELVKAMAHNNFWLDAVRAVDYGSTVRIQVKAGAAVSQGTFKSYVLNKKQGTVNALTPAINSNSYTVLALANIGKIDGEEVQKAIGNHTRFSSDVSFDEKVGIGTTSPAYKLDVRSSSADASIYVKDGATGAPIRLRSNGSSESFIYLGNEASSISRAGGDLNFNANNIDMTFSTNNGSAKHMFINTSGNIGIGTTSPAAKLTISASSDDGILLQSDNALLGNTGSGYTQLIFWNGSAMFYGRNTTGVPGGSGGVVDDHVFRTNGATRMQITSSGNVGIGTTSPIDALHVKGSATSSRGIHLENPNDSSYTNVVHEGTGRTWSTGVGNASAGLTGLRNNYYIYDSGASSTRLLINTSGNVGIGTTSPSRKLHVSAGSGDIAAKFENTSSNGTVLHLQTTGDGKSMYFQTDHIYVSSGSMHFGNETGDIYLRTSAGGGVGIGTTSPSTKLDVNGVITATGGNSTNWNTAYGWGNHSGQYLPINGGTVGGAVTINGALVVNGTITENSSLRVKENIITSDGHLEKINKLRPVKYNKIDSDKTEIGLIAEEVEEVYPEFIQYDENGDPIGIHYSRLTASLIGAIKELTKEVEELKSKING